MILDNFAMLSGSVSGTTLTGQTVTGTNTSVLSTNTMDLGPLALGGNQVGDVGAGESLEIAIGVTTAAAGGTSVQFQLIQADDAALTSNVQVINQTDAIATATLTAGAVIPLHWDRAAPLTPKRYVGVRYVIVGAMSAGAYTAMVVKSVADVKSIYFKSGYAVS